MTDVERKTFCAALSRYGAQAQITIAFEEMAELQNVLCKFLPSVRKSRNLHAGNQQYPRR